MIGGVEPLVLGAAIAAVGVMIALAMRYRAIRGVLPSVDVVAGCTVRLDPDAAGFSVEPMRSFPPRLEMNQPMQERWTSGDPLFDRRIAVIAEERWLAAIMTEELRAAILELDSICASSIGGGVLRGRVFAGPERMQRASHLAVRVAVMLSEPIDVVKALGENAKHDALAAVRKRCLEMLIRDHAPNSKQLAFEMLQDADPGVRLLAARHAGPKAIAVLWSLAREPELMPRLRADAIQEYVSLEMFDEARASLLTLFRERQPPQVEAALARAAGMIGGPFEAPLIAMLKQDDDAVVREAVKALTRIGTIDCVEALLRLAARSSAADEVRASARRAVATIQSANRGERGRLSVVDAGHLSMKDDDSRES